MTLIGKLKDLTINRDGSQNITVTVESDFKETFDELFGKDVNIEIKKYSKRRSMDSNNLAWALIDQIAEKMNLSKTEVYRDAIKEIGGVSEIVCVQDFAVDKLVKGWTHKGLGWQADVERSKLPNCYNVTLYFGSSMFDTRQMSALINILVQQCNTLGLPTLTETEIERSLAVWAKKIEKNEQAESKAVEEE